MARIVLQPEGAAEPIEAEVAQEGPGRLTVRQGERVLSAEILAGDGEGVLRLGNSVEPFFWARVSSELHVWLRGETYRFRLPEGTRERARGVDTAPASGEIAAPMPGTVLKVLVDAGASVAAGQALVVLESMKMELTVPAPGAGRVRDVLVAPGERVEQGAVLVRLESEP